MNKFQIVHAEENNLLELESIIKEAYQIILKTLSRPPGALINTQYKLKDALKNNGLFTILNSEGNIIGTFSLIPVNNESIKIYHFAIRPQFQNKGLGTSVMEEIIHYQKLYHPENKNIILEIYLKIPFLLKFYKNLGFKLIGEKEIHCEKILILTKSLIDSPLN